MTPPELIPNGTSLSDVPGLTARQRKVLRDSWIVTAQEFVALAQCPDVVRHPLARALGVDPAGLDALAQAAEGVIPATRDIRSRQLGLEAGQTDYGRGALLDEPMDEIARRRALPPYEPPGTRKVLAPSADLLDQLPELRSQGSRGTCVAHATLALREQLEITAGAPKEINLSEQFVYWWCKVNDGIPKTSGTYVAVAMRGLRELGAPLEEMWPYVSDPAGPDEGQGPPPAGCANGDPALRTARTIELNPSDIGGIKSCLAEGRAVAFSVPVFDSWYYSGASRRWGKITLPLPGEAEDGGHAMTLVGYQDDPAAPGGGYFLVRNSWQPWAFDGVWQEGYGAIPYAYISRHANAAFSAVRREGAEVYGRDALADDGRRPLARPGWNSPDIWLRHDAMSDQSLTGEHQTPRRGESNAVFARVFNRGPAYAYNVPCEVFVAPLAPWIRPEDWQRIEQTTAPHIAPGHTVFGPIFWRVPPDGPEQVAYRVRLTGEAEQPSPVYSALAFERHLWLAEVAPGGTVEIAFDAHGLDVPGQATTLRIEQEDLPAAVAVSAITLDPGGAEESRMPSWTPRPPPAPGVTLAASEHRRARLTLTAPADAAGGTVYRFSVAQFVGQRWPGGCRWR
jgi:hypothetical protein